VRGDYGTGKTHLLLFTEAKLRALWPKANAKVVVLCQWTTEVSH
jgi:chromosomal replication initiation ATPase DnaA